MAAAPHTTQPATTALQAQTFAATITTIATDIGRLRRRLQDDEYASHLVDRLSMGIDGLDAFLWPTAGELVSAGLDVGVALERVDRRARTFRELLGECER